MEDIKTAIQTLDGALNAQIELIKKIELRLLSIENRNQDRPAAQDNLVKPRTEYELKEIAKLPDCVKELQTFDGNAVQYVSWIHSVENILQDYNLVKNKPIYRAILQAIRGKVRGNADAALISYNIFDDDWEAIKTCLSLHYADKRDMRTLEYQMSMLTQGKLSIDEFYAKINHQFSLIVNKIKTGSYSQETMNALVESQRNRALDVFIRGVNGEMSKYLMVQKPDTLPEAYSACLDLQNYNCRGFSIHNKTKYNPIITPINSMSNKVRPPYVPHPNYRQQQQSTQQQSTQQLSTQQRNAAYNIQHQRPIVAPPRPPKPLERMDVDQSIQTRRVDYMNRPLNLPFESHKRSPSVSYHQGDKNQRLYHMEATDEGKYSEFLEDEYGYNTENDEYQESPEYEEDVQEVNFMTDASQASPT